MAQLRTWCDETGVALIEDCAHALFGNAGERRVGAWGDLAIASLTKFLPVPEGGCLICNQAPGEPLQLGRHRLVFQLKLALDILEEGARHAALPGLNGLLRTVFDLKRVFVPAGPLVLRLSNLAINAARGRLHIPRLADTASGSEPMWTTRPTVDRVGA